MIIIRKNFVLIVLSLLTIFTGLTGCTYDCEKYIILDVTPLDIHGEVMYKDISFTSNRIQYMEQGKIKNLQVFEEYNGMPFIRYLQPGDSIIKNIGTLVFEVRRGNSVEFFEFSCTK